MRFIRIETNFFRELVIIKMVCRLVYQTDNKEHCGCAYEDAMVPIPVGFDGDVLELYYYPFSGDIVDRLKRHWTARDDWFLFYRGGEVENHELCDGCDSDGTCPFHPPDCDCSDGACQPWAPETDE